MSMFGFRKLIGLAVVGTVFVGCGGAPSEMDSSEIKVTNGISLGQDDFPSVVLLNMRSGWFNSSICTGTFVNDYQVVTAAHCVQNNPRITALGVRATSYSYQPEYSMSIDGGVNLLDLAVVNFPRNTATSWTELADLAPEQDSLIEIVGYGNNKIAATPGGGITGSGSGVKRYGQNFVYERDGGMVSIIGVPEEGIQIGEDEPVIELGAYASTGSGDSGGPLFFEGKLAAVTSGGGVGTNEDGLTLAIGRFTDLSSPESQEFLNSVLDSTL